MHTFRAGGQFTIPMERGLSPLTADLDRMSFSEWLRGSGMDSRILNWYMNYCCRDDLWRAGIADIRHGRAFTTSRPASTKTRAR